MRDDQVQYATGAVPFGQLLRELRLSAGFSQEALAELARMSTGGIGVLERGIRRAPQRETLELLAGALNLSPEERERFTEAARRAGNSRRRRSQTPADRPRLSSNLPFALTSFVGREPEVALLQRYLLEHRLTTLTGAGGVGKTRLAIEAAHGAVDSFRDGVWLVELAPLADAELVEQRIAESLGVAGSASTRPDAWINELVDKQLLLIVDNCEHLLAPCAATTKRLLERCPHIHVLATSREPLQLTGERVIRLDTLGEAAAMELFYDRARDSSSRFAVADEDVESRKYVRTICEELDGIPFAIELAAARLSSLSLKALSENIGQRLKLLRQSAHATVPRHETMYALIDWSYNLLSPREKRVFEELSIFSGGCTIESVTSVCNDGGSEGLDILETLTSLVQKSLVVVDFDLDEPRYGLLETSREFAWEKLAMRGEVDKLQRRHALAYLELARRLDERWSKAPDRAWHTQARSELENWRSAINWALGERRDVLLGQSLIGSLQPVWITVALAEGRRWCRVASELVTESTPREVVARLQYTEAIIGFLSGQVTVSLAAAERALAGYRSLDDPRGVVMAETIIGRLLVESGKLAEGERSLLDALETAQAIDDPLLAAVTHQGLGLSRGMAGDLEGARSHVNEALAIARAASSADRIAVVAVMVSAEAHLLAGDVESAIALGNEAVELARRLGDEFGTMRTFSNLAAYLVAADRFAEAREAARESLEFSRLAQGATTVAWTLQHLAMVAALRHKSDDAHASHDLERAALLFGFTSARLADLGARGDPSDSAERERLYSILLSALGRDERERFITAGAVMSEARAIDEAMMI